MYCISASKLIIINIDRILVTCNYMKCIYMLYNVIHHICSSQNIPEIEGYGEDKGLTNPIGVLQEMCMSRHWPPPKYTMEGEEGLPHERKFTIVCSIMSLREVGFGKSKKIAKRHAAHKMWLTLHDTNNLDGDEVRLFIYICIYMYIKVIF